MLCKRGHNMPPPPHPPLSIYVLPERSHSVKDDSKTYDFISLFE